MFQKNVDALIERELKNISLEADKTKEDAKAIHDKQSPQSKINDLIEKESKKSDS